MTDVEVKTPNKRKSLPNKQGGPQSPNKKAKFQKTPQKQKSPKNAFQKPAQGTPKPQKTPNKPQKTPNKPNNVQNITPKSNKKNRKNSETNDDSPKKIKPFAGTSELESPKDKRVQSKTEKKNEKRKGQFFELTNKVKSGDKSAALTDVENKIKAIEERGELTKTARRKLKLLKRLRNICEGKPLGPANQEKDPHAKSISTKRRERKKVAKQQAMQNKPVSGNQEEKGVLKANGKANKAKLAQKQAVQKVVEVESDDDESDEVEGSEDESDNEADLGSEDEANVEEDEDDSEEGEEEADSDEESEDDSPPQNIRRDSEEVSPKEKSRKPNAPIKDKTKPKDVNQTKNKNPIDLEKLQKIDLIAKNQKRFVLFVGNIPFDTTKHDLIEHFQKCGEIKHIRIPTEKKSSRPRGFAYVELSNEEAYQKCMSMHHSSIKGRRINVLYTQGGKKKGEDKKKEIKEKNFKLHAMRKQGMLAGSKKDTQKRSFRRAKQKSNKNESNAQD